MIAVLKVLGPCLVETLEPLAVGSAVGLAAGLAAGLSAGFSAAAVVLEPEGLDLSSSEKLFFSHLDGKHMVGASGGGKKGRSGRRENSEGLYSRVLHPLHLYQGNTSECARMVEKLGTNWERTTHVKRRVVGRRLVSRAMC